MRLKPENRIEQHLRRSLEQKGFKCLKLITPGTSHVMDRMILAPKDTPKGTGPWFVELKAEGKPLRRAQELRAEEWAERGCLVLEPIDSIEKADKCVEILNMAVFLARMVFMSDTPQIDTDTLGCV